MVSAQLSDGPLVRGSNCHIGIGLGLGRGLGFVLGLGLGLGLGLASNFGIYTTTFRTSGLSDKGTLGQLTMNQCYHQKRLMLPVLFSFIRTSNHKIRAATYTSYIRPTVEYTSI